MTKFTFTFKTVNNEIIVMEKEFNSYMSAMNFGAEYFATHNIVYYTMK